MDWVCGMKAITSPATLFFSSPVLGFCWRARARRRMTGGGSLFFILCLVACVVFLKKVASYAVFPDLFLIYCLPSYYFNYYYAFLLHD